MRKINAESTVAANTQRLYCICSEKGSASPDSGTDYGSRLLFGQVFWNPGGCQWVTPARATPTWTFGTWILQENPGTDNHDHSTKDCR